MRRVTIRAPQGRGEELAQLAFAAGVEQVSMQQVRTLRPRLGATVQDVLEVETATPTARAFVSAVVRAPFYDRVQYPITIVHPRASVGSEEPRAETRPVVMPEFEVYEELWQYSHVTPSFVVRIFIASLLVAHGMISGIIPLLIAGLLFLPFHHQMLAIAVGLWTRELRLARQGAVALAVATALIVAGGACVAAVTERPLLFEEFGSPLSGFVIALVVGVAAALASADDSGRRELIGLAATAHISVLPAWFGIALVFGMADVETTSERLLSFVVSVVTLTGSATITYAVLRLRRDGVLRSAASRGQGSM